MDVEGDLGTRLTLGPNFAHLVLFGRVDESCAERLRQICDQALAARKLLRIDLSYAWSVEQPAARVWERLTGRQVILTWPAGARRPSRVWLSA